MEEELADLFIVELASAELSNCEETVTVSESHRIGKERKDQSWVR